MRLSPGSFGGCRCLKSCVSSAVRNKGRRSCPVGVSEVNKITRSEYNALLRWADDGGDLVDVESYDIVDDDAPLVRGQGEMSEPALALLIRETQEPVSSGHRNILNSQTVCGDKFE